MQSAVEQRNPEALLSWRAVVQRLGNDMLLNLTTETEEYAWRFAKMGHPSGHLMARTGRFIRSIDTRIVRAYRVGRAAETRVGSAFVGARVHELGAVIVPRRAKHLRFRIWRDSDISNPTGPWVVTDRAVIPARPTFNPAAQMAVARWRIIGDASLTRVKRELGATAK